MVMASHREISCVSQSLSPGFWSDGHRLKDNVKMGGEGLRETRSDLSRLL